MKHTFKKIKQNQTRTFFSGLALCGAISGLLAAPAIVSAQTSTPFGFEDNSIGGWIGGSNTETVTVNSNAADSRTGLYSLKMTTTSTSSNKQWYTSNPYDSAYSGVTVFFIYWAKADATASADGSFKYANSIPPSSYSSKNASGGVQLTTTGWTRVTNSESYTSSGTRYYFPAPRKTTSGATSVYLDDGVLYSSTASNPTVDTFKPGTPSAVTGIASGNLVTLNWTSNTDAETGVQATLILRNANTNAAPPVLNDQALYSATGGSAGPDSVSGGWQIVSATTGPTDVSYLDAAPGAGNYIYAVALRDLAYNYSVAGVSASITASAPVPTIFTNQAGFNGSFGSVITGTTAAESTYSISAYNLTGNLVVTAPAGFQVSTTTGTGFNTTANLVPVNGQVASTTIYVHYNPTVPNGATGLLNITNTSAGANTVNIPVSGNAMDTLPTVASTISFGTVTDKTVVVNLPTVGNGSNRIIVISQGGTVNYTPVDGTAATGVNADYSLATDQGGGNKIVYDGTGSGNNVVTVTNLHSNTLYSFAVYDYNKGTGSTSQDYLPISPATALVKTDTFNLAVNNIGATATVKIYPNPTHGTVYIQSPVSATITLCDITGRILYTRQNATTAALNDLSSGLYILTITNDKGDLLKREKIVVQ